MTPLAHTADPKLDLTFERIVDVKPELVWKAWTTPELLKKWFVPAPWSTVKVELDLRPGGNFHFVMRSPEGQEFPSTGCVLEVVPNRKFVWTSVLGPGYRPAKPVEGGKPCDEIMFTAVITLEPHGNGTKYTALAIHGDEATRTGHEKMGFHDGWGKAFDQLVALMKTLK